MLQYLQIYKDTKKKILQGDWKPGCKVPCHRELCEDYDVSITTITRAMNQLKKEGYVESYRGMGTVVADLARSGGVSRSNKISLLSYHQYFMQDAVSFAVQDVFSGSSWSIHSRFTHSNLEWYREALIDNRKNPPAGMILLSMHSTQFRYDEEVLPDLSTQVVLVDHEISHRRYDLVCSNSYANGKTLAEYLLAKGYREFVHVTDAKPAELKVSKSLQGMREVLAGCGIAFGPEQYRRFENPHSFGVPLEPFEDSYHCVRNLLSRERPRVIVTPHDWCAVGAVRAILDAGLRIPEDIAVASMGTTVDLSGMAAVPKITAIDVMMEYQVRVAAEVVKARLEGLTGPPVYREFSGRIVEGQTA